MGIPGGGIRTNLPLYRTGASLFRVDSPKYGGGAGLESESGEAESRGVAPLRVEW